MLLSTICWIIASSIYLMLGLIHLVYTFYGQKLFPRNEQLTKEMQSSHLVLTMEKSVWDTWKGFNASHSIGAMYFAIINMTLALSGFDRFPMVWFFLSTTIIVSLFYLYLAHKFWFSIPFTGILISTVLYWTGLMLMFVK